MLSLRRAVSGNKIGTFFNLKETYKNSYRNLVMRDFRQRPNTRIFQRSYSDKCGKPVLTLFTKEDCQLCDEALEMLGSRLDQVELREVDITLPENENWFNKYRYEIPVFYLNQKFLCKNRIDLDLFDREFCKLTDKMS